MEKIQEKKVIEHVIKTWGENRKCPMCGESKWWISNNVFELREFHGGGLILGSGPVIPVIPVSCKNCGNTIFLNAIVAGITELPKDKKEVKK